MRRVTWSLLLASLISAGCYTVLRHPPVDTSESEPAAERVAVRSDCTLCHSDLDLVAFEYGFQPGWYPVYGPWPQWYAEPWWMTVTVPHPDAARAGTRTSAGAGLVNDRGPAGGGAAPSGVWSPPPAAPPTGGVVIVPGSEHGQQPRAPGPAAEPSQASPGGLPAGKDPAVSPPRSGTVTPAPEAPATTPRASQPAAEPKTPPKNEAAPDPRPSQPAEAPRTDESQGRGMTNDRRGPKP